MDGGTGETAVRMRRMIVAVAIVGAGCLLAGIIVVVQEIHRRDGSPQ